MLTETEIKPGLVLNVEFPQNFTTLGQMRTNNESIIIIGLLKNNLTKKTIMKIRRKSSYLELEKTNWA